jgi:hypothetical protein
MNDAAVRGLSGNATGAVSFSNFYGKSLSYAIAPNLSSVNEGSSVTFTVTTTGLPTGTVLYWSTAVISGSVNTVDFTDSVLSGSVTVNNNTASIVRTLTNDTTTEGTESFQLQLHTDSTVGTVVATSSTVTINDTSIAVPGQFIYAGTLLLNANNSTVLTTFTVPLGVTSISMVAIGAGGGGITASIADTTNRGGMAGAGGGGLRYINNYSVTPGQVLNIGGGRGGGTGALDSGSTGGQGGSSWVRTAANATIIQGFGGLGGKKHITTTTNVTVPGRSGGSHQGISGSIGYAGGAGGDGYNGNNTISTTIGRGGGGGAAGYSGAGGRGGSITLSLTAPTAGSGGGGGGGGGKRSTGGTVSAPSASNRPARGGGVSPFGQGTNGAAGANSNDTVSGSGTAGGNGSGSLNYGSGAEIGSPGGNGVVRIIWPGNLRQFPSTRTADE